MHLPSLLMHLPTLLMHFKLIYAFTKLCIYQTWPILARIRGLRIDLRQTRFVANLQS